MSAPVQPGDLRVNRANIYRRIGRVCFESGGQPGLPAPSSASFTTTGTLELHFDALAEAAAWCERYDLHRKEWTEQGLRCLDGYGTWDGFDISVRGWAPVDGSVPEDDGPDDLSVPASAWVAVVHLMKAGGLGAQCGSVIRYIDTCAADLASVNCAACKDVPSIEDGAPRGTDDAEHHEPVPADVEGHPVNGRHHDEPEGGDA